MACPFFREDYLGCCCTATRMPYVPSIAEMEQHCFKGYGQCWAFRSDAYSEPVGSDASAQSPVKRGSSHRSQLTFASRGDAQWPNLRNGA